MKKEQWISPIAHNLCDAISESDGTGRTGKGWGLAASVTVGADRGMLRQPPTPVHVRTDPAEPGGDEDPRPSRPLIVSPLFICDNTDRFRSHSHYSHRLRGLRTTLPLMGAAKLGHPTNGLSF